MPASQLGWAWQLEKNRGKAATRRRGPTGTKKAGVKSLGFFVFLRVSLRGDGYAAQFQSNSRKFAMTPARSFTRPFRSKV